MTTIGQVMRLARADGIAATHVARVKVLGMRPRQQLSASDAQPQSSANGIGPRSVWTGPVRAFHGGALPGAPMLRRP